MTQNVYQTIKVDERKQLGTRNEVNLCLNWHTNMTYNFKINDMNTIFPIFWETKPGTVYFIQPQDTFVLFIYIKQYTTTLTVYKKRSTYKMKS